MDSAAVIIPHYNSCDWLLEAVDSALAQTVPTEVIVVDDGSTARTAPGVLEAAANKGARVIKKANGGVSSARNAGIAATNADFIIPLDADDKLAPQAAERALSIVAADPTVSIVCWDQYLFGADSGIRRCEYTGIESMLESTTIPNTSLFRRSLWEQGGGYPEELDTGEDWAFWMRAIRAGGKVEVLHEPLSWYRVSDHQTTASLSPLRVSKAQNLVLLENAHLYSQEDLAQQLAATRTMLAHYRHNYTFTEAAKGWIKKLVRR